MARKKNMTEYKGILRHLKAGESIRGIQRETGIHRTIIRKIHKEALKKGWLEPFAPLPRDEELAACLEKQTAKAHSLDAFQERIAAWVKKEFSYVVMHRLIAREYICSEATVRRYVKKNFRKAPAAVMVRDTVAGETMEVDFGYLGLTYDHDTGKRRKTYLFSGRLNHSRKTYREIVFNQKQETFFTCHVRTFEYFGGVPCKVVPDNLKAAVIRASFESPLVNRVYHALAEHYGFLINPCLPRCPEHKGGVENDIKYVKRNFWPFFCEEQLEKGRETPLAGDIQGELDLWTREVAETRLIGGVGRTVDEIFVTEEKPVLLPLPGARWEQISWACAKVQENWRIQFQKAFYSVPYAYIGKTVQVMATLTAVHIFLSGKEITVHSRAGRAWQYVRKSEHAPPHPEQYMSLTRETIARQARSVGRSTYMVVNAIFNQKAVDGLRPARALIGLARKYSPARLEAACTRALSYESPEYASVKSILTKGLDRLDDNDEPIAPTGQRLFAFARERGYWNTAITSPKEGDTHERTDIAQTPPRAPEAVRHA
jgi:predicted transcriptional regulator